MRTTKHVGFLASVAVAFASVALLSSCGGGSAVNPPLLPSGGSSPSASPNPSPSPTISPSTQILHANQGAIVGVDDMFTPISGDTASGGSGAAVDGITCDPTMSDNYHIHIFLGIYVNGTHYALPIAIGMVNPGAPVAGFINSAQCFYHIHSHDSSGIVHVEDPDPSGAPRTASLFTLKNVLDVWGITVDGSHVGQFTGPVVVMTSGQVYRGGQNNGLVPSSTYTFYSGDPNNIPLYSHEVIWLMVGPTYPSSLDSVSFYTAF